jgi:hypothetical protein
MIFVVASLTDSRPRRFIDVAEAVRRLNVGKLNGSSWESLWSDGIQGLQ